MVRKATAQWYTVSNSSNKTLNHKLALTTARTEPLLTKFKICKMPTKLNKFHIIMIDIDRKPKYGKPGT